MPTWAVGRRDGWAARKFIEDLAGRLAHRVQLTTDGHKVYLEAVEGAFGSEIDYAMLETLSIPKYCNPEHGNVMALPARPRQVSRQANPHETAWHSPVVPVFVKLRHYPQPSSFPHEPSPTYTRGSASGWDDGNRL